MKTFHLLDRSFVRRILLAACIALLLAPFAVGMPRAAYAEPVPPAVPGNLQVPAGSRLFFSGHAVGTQNYVCLPAGTGVRFALFTPQATLYNEQDEQVATHFFSPNPADVNTVRAAWLHSRDSSTVWGRVKEGGISTDPAYVAPGAIPWLLIEVMGTQNGPDGGDRLSTTKFIQRVNTVGGAAPSTGCASTGDIGNQAFVPYEADYFFYR